ncbi:MAG: hypothetical protein AABY22_31920, partial [Nanoarchaeota archaeon]
TSNNVVIYAEGANYAGGDVISVDFVQLIIAYTIPDSEYPIFSNFQEVPSNSTAYVSGALYRFNSTVTSTNATVGIEFNGINYTASNLTASVFNASVSNLGAGTYPYYWFAWGNGTDKNYNISSLRYSTVAKASQSITPLLNGANANLAIIFPQQINASYSGTNQTAVSININSTSVNIGQNYTWGAGGWVVNYSAPTNQNYSLFLQYLNLTINRATSEVNLTLNSTERNITINQGNTILLNGTLITGDTGATLQLYNNGTLINQGTREVSNTTTFSNSGLFNITVIYVQSQNYSQSSETYWVNVTSADTTAPLVTINQPTPAGVNLSTSSVNFNVTTDEDAGAALYTLNGGITNYTMTKNGNRDFNATNTSIADGT